MIRILMSDLGETLIHDNSVLPNVVDALEAIHNFKTAANEPLSLCLVSDFKMPADNRDETINGIFDEYLLVLEQVGLIRFFEPVNRHVTLSTHAGVYKPDPHFFEVAINRLSVSASLKECLFITENSDHITACQNLGMETLKFCSSGSTNCNFHDWIDAPLLVAHLLNDESENNLKLALKVQLSVKHDLELLSINETLQSGLKIRANKWYPIPDKHAGVTKLQVPIPVNAEILLDKKGMVREVTSNKPESEIIEEAVAFVEALEENKQISHGSGPLSSETTHQIVSDEKGNKRLVRKRFKAF